MFIRFISLPWCKGREGNTCACKCIIIFPWKTVQRSPRARCRDRKKIRTYDKPLVFLSLSSIFDLNSDNSLSNGGFERWRPCAIRLYCFLILTQFLFIFQPLSPTHALLSTRKLHIIAVRSGFELDGLYLRTSQPWLLRTFLKQVF